MVVESGEEGVVPCAVYVDGTPYLRRDSVLVLLVVNLLTRTRHLVALLRKATLCRCGCSGWCTIWPVLNKLRWSFRASRSGRWPTGGCAGMRWDPDSWRGNMAGCLMRTRACILQIKQDMQELSSTHGFFGHGHNECPCPLCTCDRGSMHHASGVDPQSLPFNLVTAEAYWDSCRQHEVVTRIMLWTDLLQVRASLLCVKGKRGGQP